MYHYVSRFPGAIAVSPEHFEDQCRGMAEHGWRGIGLDEAEAFLLKGAPLPPRSLLITFDDGYLDNYVYAWPILRKYGHKGVVFAVTERMEAEKKCRPTLAEVWEGLPPSSLPPVDAPMHDTPFGYQVRRDMFFSWEEARHMESSGVMAVAAHSARHLAVFAGPEWGPVNRHDRHQKPASALEAAGQRFHVPGTRANTFNAVDFPEVWGLPRFKERPFLYSRAFIPSPDLVAAVQRLVPQEPAEARTFFQSAGNVAALETLVAGFSPDRLGTLESEAAAAAVCMKNWAPARKRSAGNWGILCARCAGRGEAGPRLRGKRGGKPDFPYSSPPAWEPTRLPRPRPCTASKYATRGGAGSGSGWKSIRGRGWPACTGRAGSDL